MLSHPPQDIRFCRSRDGTRIAYAVCGKGPSLLWAPHFIHHIDLDWESPLWCHWLTLLTTCYTVIRYDCRGCGLSDRDQVEFSFERYVEDMEAVVAAAGLDRFVLLGNSNGAHVAAAFAARHPARPTHLVLHSCQTRGRLQSNPTPQQIDEVEARIKMITLAWPNEHVAYSQFSPTLHIPEATAELKLAHNDLLRRTTSPDNIVRLIHAIGRSDLRDVLPNVPCPTLVLHARRDQIIRFEEGRAAAALIPGARFVPLETSNHILLETEPAWQRLVEALEDFLPAPATTSAAAMQELTPREREILEAVAEGLDNDRIATRFQISEKTVRNHVSMIFSKLGANSRAQAVALARDAGFGRRSNR